MKHARQTIREAVGALLKSAAITGTRVYENRLYPVQSNDLPCLLVITNGDRSQNTSVNSNPTQQRDVDVQIKAVVKASIDLDDDMDELCAQVETAIAGASFSFKGSQVYLGTDQKESAIGNQPVGESTLFYRFTIRTKENDPLTIV